MMINIKQTTSCPAKTNDLDDHVVGLYDAMQYSDKMSDGVCIKL